MKDTLVDRCFSLIRLACAALLLGGFCTAEAPAASPAVDAALALPRTEPRHYVDTALALAELGATAEATQIAEEFVALNADDARLADLVAEVGSARMIRLARMLPTTAAVVERALAAAASRSRSPERLANLVEQLQGDRDGAIAAIRELRLTGPAGAAFCIQQLQTADDPTTRARLREALVALDPISLPALLEATGDDSEAVRTEAAFALGRLAELDRLRSPIVAPLLLAGTSEEGAAGEAARWAILRVDSSAAASAETALTEAIEHLLSPAPLFSAGVETPEGFRMRLAARLAADRAALSPENRQAQGDAALLALESGKEDASLDQLPTADLATAIGRALELHLDLAAQRACEALGARRDLQALLGKGGRPSGLVSALQASSANVRFSALQAILAIDPQQPFAGSSHVIDVLEELAAARGEDLAIVAYPQLAKASQTASWLQAAGYQAIASNSGSEAIEQATQSADTALLLIDMSTSLPNTREALFRLRRTAVTASTPVALLAADGRLGDAQRLAEEHGGESAGVIAIPRPHSAESTASLASRLESLRLSNRPDAATRAARAEEARIILGRLAAEGPSFYGVDRRALRPTGGADR